MRKGKVPTELPDRGGTGCQHHLAASKGWGGTYITWGHFVHLDATIFIHQGHIKEVFLAIEVDRMDKDRYRPDRSNKRFQLVIAFGFIPHSLDTSSSLLGRIFST